MSARNAEIVTDCRALVEAQNLGAIAQPTVAAPTRTYYLTDWNITNAVAATEPLSIARPQPCNSSQTTDRSKISRCYSTKRVYMSSLAFDTAITS